MDRLRISDLSFCETVSDSQICGGLSAETPSSLLRFLETYISNEVSVLANEVSVFAQPLLERYSSEETEGYLVEKFKDESGNNFAYQAISKDGKKRVGASTGILDNVNYAFSTAKIST